MGKIFTQLHFFLHPVKPAFETFPLFSTPGKSSGVVYLRGLYVKHGMLQYAFKELKFVHPPFLFHTYLYYSILINLGGDILSYSYSKLSKLVLICIFVFLRSFHSSTMSADLSLFTYPNDTPFVELDCTEAFNGLTKNEKLYAHYLSQASWYGGLIVYVQVSVLFYFVNHIFF